MGNAEALAALVATIPTAQPASPAAPVVKTPAAGAAVDPAAPAAAAASPELESTRFTHLAKKEAELQRARETFKAEQTQFMTEKQKNQKIYDNLTKFNELKLKDPVAALKFIGFNEKDLFNFIAAQQDTRTPEERARGAAQDEIKKFTDKQASDAAAANEVRTKEVLGTFRSNIDKTIASNTEKYEYVNFHGTLAADLVYETVTAVLMDDLKTNPKALPISLDEACQMVEDYYEEQDKAMSALKKRQPQTPEQQAAAAAAQPLKAEVSPRPKPSPTLSSKAGASIASTSSRVHGESADAKKARLINKYFGAPQ